MLTDIDYFKNSNTLYYTNLPTFTHLNALYDLVTLYGKDIESPIK